MYRFIVDPTSGLITDVNSKKGRNIVIKYMVGGHNGSLCFKLIYW